MKKSTKGAVAAAAAGVLLMGGAGSLAFWTGSSSVAASTITAGELKLGTASCGSWTFVTGGATFVPASDKVVPGDSITRVCTIPITAVGTNIKADLTLPTQSVTKNPTDANFTATASYKVGTAAGTAVSKSSITATDNSANIYATLTVTFPFGTSSTANAQNGNGTQSATAALDALAVVATQTTP